MAIVTLQIEGYRCERCGHEWVARRARNLTAAQVKKTEKETGAPVRPRICPGCKSAWWDVAPAKGKAK